VLELDHLERQPKAFQEGGQAYILEECELGTCSSFLGYFWRRYSW
jgi:hypothetical protein